MSMTGSSFDPTKWFSSGLMISAGCSNMLSDRRNCFRGRCIGLDGLRTWLATDSPIARRFDEDCLCLGGGPIEGVDGESADWGLPSLCGDSLKSACGVVPIGDLRATPLPNLNGGHSILLDLRLTTDVVNPFVRASEGLAIETLRRLRSTSQQASLGWEQQHQALS